VLSPLASAVKVAAVRADGRGSFYCLIDSRVDSSIPEFEKGAPVSKVLIKPAERRYAIGVKLYASAAGLLGIATRRSRETRTIPSSMCHMAGSPRLGCSFLPCPKAGENSPGIASGRQSSPVHEIYRATIYS
jgi:hypothetical protein